MYSFSFQSEMCLCGVGVLFYLFHVFLFFVQDSDIELAKELVEQDKMHKKILEM